ncbi:CHAT domain-containing protein [Kitasatospora griseola]|uniref:CHAT domain-containing protein n=1 Tax=Kitasatospora griseola TaxID=2064 RepID=UPI0036DD4974
MLEDPTSRSAPTPLLAIRRRITLFGESGDLRHLTDPEAEREYAAAMAAAVRVDHAGERQLNIAAMADLVRFRFWRGTASGTLEGQAEADDAVSFFLGLRQAVPDLVPAEVADLVELLATNATHRLRWTVSCADTLLSLAAGTDIERLDKAIDCVRRALETASTDPEDRILALGRLGRAYQERYQGSGDVADARNAVAVHREAVDLSPQGRNRARRLSLLAGSLAALYEQTREKPLLEEAVRVLEESVATTPPGDQFLGLRHQRLGQAYRRLAEVTGSIADFDASVRWARLACVTIDSSDADYGSTLTTLDKSLRARHAKAHDRADLDEVVALWRTAITRIAGDSARTADFLEGLSAALQRRFDSEGDPADLRESVQVCAAAAAAAPKGGLSSVRYLSYLCFLLRRRFEHDGDLADLQESVRVGRIAVGLTSPDGGEDGIITYSNLLNALIACYGKDREPAYLDEALELWTKILAETPADHPERGPRLAGNLDVLEMRFEHTGDRADLERVFAAARDCLADVRPDFGQLAETLHRVAHRLGIRADQSERTPQIGLELDNARLRVLSCSAAELDAMDTLVELARSAMPRTAADKAHLQLRWSLLAVALGTRYRVMGVAGDGSEAVRVMREALAAADPDDAQYSVLLSNLGEILVTGFLRDDNPSDLDAAIEAYERAFRTVLPTAPARAEYLPKLTSALRLRYDDRRSAGGLEHIVAVVRSAVADERPAPDCRSSSLSELARVFEWRFHHTGDRADLDAAVGAAREAVNLEAGSGTRSTPLLSRLSSVLFTRYEQMGNAADLDEAISTLERALADRPVGDEARLVQLHNHAVYVHVRALLTGSSADLDRSVVELREVASARSPDDPGRSLDFYSLGLALRVRHSHLGEDADLHSAVEAHRTSLQEAAADPLMRATAAFGLANTLSLLFERTRDKAVLDEAITLAVAAEPDFPEHGGNVSQPLSILSWLLRTRVDLPGDPDPADVAEMLRVSKRMIDTTHPDSHNYGLLLRNRAAALVTAAQVRRDALLLDEAVDTAQQAVDATHPGDARRAEWLWSLGLIRQKRYGVTGNRADLEATLACWREAARDRYGAPDMVMRCAVRAGRLAAGKGDIDGAVADYSLAVKQLPTVAWHGMRTEVRSDTLRRWSGLASEAAGAAIAAGQPVTAIEVLEQGRSVIWTQALDLRSDLSDLAGSHPDLAERITALRGRLDTFSPAGEPHGLISPTGGPPARGSSTNAGERHRDLARQWDEAVAQVRGIEGFEHFLRPTPYGELKDAARGGPVVVVNASRYGCHALIVRHDAPEPEVVELSEVSLQDVSGKASDLLSAVSAQTSPGTSFLARERARHVSHDVLGWLWDRIVWPVLTRLGHSAHPPSARSADAPRLWWYPVGLFSLLPLHAAGHHPRHSSTAHPGGTWTADLVISSYTPTLAALSRSRIRRPEPAARRHLAIGLPETPGLAALPAVAHELTALSRYAANSIEVTRLVGADATRRAVLDELRRCERIHFACHAAQDLADPAASAFRLHDGLLSIADIAELQLASELAYLSACQTAMGVPDLADEVIHLAAALQLTGCRHIVATSWAVGDSSAAETAEHFYRELASADSGGQPAMALHRAVRALHNSDPTDPMKWASYVHIGS